MTNLQTAERVPQLCRHLHLANTVPQHPLRQAGPADTRVQGACKSFVVFMNLSENIAHERAVVRSLLKVFFRQVMESWVLLMGSGCRKDDRTGCIAE